MARYELVIGEHIAAKFFAKDQEEVLQEAEQRMPEISQDALRRIVCQILFLHGISDVVKTYRICPHA